MTKELLNVSLYAVDSANPIQPEQVMWATQPDGNDAVVALDGPRSALIEILQPHFRSLSLTPPESLLVKLEKWSAQRNKSEIDEACALLAKRFLEIFNGKRNMKLTSYAIKVATGQPDISDCTQADMARKLKISKACVCRQVKIMSEQLGTRSHYMRSKHTPRAPK